MDAVVRDLRDRIRARGVRVDERLALLDALCGELCELQSELQSGGEHRGEELGRLMEEKRRAVVRATTRLQGEASRCD